MYSKALQLIALLCTLTFANAKVFGRCELAQTLVNNYGVPRNQVATWVCIAYRESNYNTAAVNWNSGDHGIFQISELYWCYPPGTGCNVDCSALENDDITDDVACFRTVYDQMGFPAWVTYNNYCQHEDLNQYIEGCF